MLDALAYIARAQGHAKTDPEPNRLCPNPSGGVPNGHEPRPLRTGLMSCELRVRSRSPGACPPNPQPTAQAAAAGAAAVSGDRGCRRSRSRIHRRLNPQEYPLRHWSLRTLKLTAPEVRAAEAVGVAAGQSHRTQSHRRRKRPLPLCPPRRYRHRPATRPVQRRARS